ncbi:MAG: aromatic ring-hydroxylating dioxygenase subunit alpha [Kangiellaceae bacterium]|nr:aromatic ring-hydroxylating dioxygenase subunit alpha [Kangiellaceae bacterium]
MTDFSSYLKLQPNQNAYALHAKTYSDPSFLTLEKKAIFENSWQLVGHISALPSIGDQITTKIGNIPIVIVRNSKNELTALHNVCRHRAGPLTVKNCNSSVLRCKYHGWTYDLNGILKSAPEMQSTSNFNVEDIRLPKAHLDTWQNFIFVAINKPTITLQAYFQGVSKQIDPLDLTSMTFSHRDKYIVECNWKAYMDNYLEGYHLPHVHPGLSKLLDYRNYDTQLYEWYSYQFSPLDNAENNNADIFYGEGSAHYYCMFPNLMLNILPGRLQTNTIIPIDHNKTEIIFDYYYSDIDSERTQKLIKQDQEFSDEVQQEDIRICEQVQVGLNSGSYQAGPLCMKRETGVLHFQNLIRKTVSQYQSTDRNHDI